MLQLVTAIEDEEILQVIKQNIEAIKTYDVTDDLLAEDFNGLKNMVNEPSGYETLSQKEFDNSIKKWRGTK